MKKTFAGVFFMAWIMGLPAAARAQDSDGDGMPDAWEKQHGLNPDDPADGAADADGNGNTNLEEYLHWLAAGNKLN